MISWPSFGRSISADLLDDLSLTNSIYSTLFLAPSTLEVQFSQLQAFRERLGTVKPFYDFSIPAATGYGGSKYIAEQLIEKATTTSNVSAVICHIGQLAGSVVKVGGV